MAMNWLAIGLALALTAMFATGVAVLARHFSAQKLEGQTFALVVLGVAGVLVISGPVIGWARMGFMFAAFTVAGIPMGIEYYARVLRANQRTMEAMQDTVVIDPERGEEE